MSGLMFTLLVCCGGCESYHYAISSGTGGFSQVVKDRGLVVAADPAGLRLRQVESRCVVLVTNPTTQPITIDGSASTLVDPHGESRGIASQLIARNSFVKLILPPYRDRDPGGPRVNFGVGFLVEGKTDRTAQYHRTAQYLDVNPTAQEYWQWDGEGAVKLILTLRQNDQSTRREFTIRRDKN